MDHSRIRKGLAIPTQQGVYNTDVPSQKRDLGAKRKRRGLHRLKKPFSFQAAAPRASSSVTSTPSTATAHLEKRLHLIDLVYRRNRNQHRNQPFFKHLCLLRKSLIRHLNIYNVLDQLAREATTTKTADQVRQRFEKEASLRSQKDLLDEHVREVLVPKCYIVFSAVVGDSQFANLGVVLVALLSEVAAGDEGVGVMRSVEAEGDRLASHRQEPATSSSTGAHPRHTGGLRMATSLLGTSTRITGEDQGEVIERAYDSGDGHEVETLADHGEGVDSPLLDNRVELRAIPTLARSEAFHCGAEGSTPRARSSVPGLEFDSGSELSEKTRKCGMKSKKRKQKNAIDDLFSGLL